MERVQAAITADSLRERFQALLERHCGIVFKVANTYCRHAEDRRDLAQEISAQLWKAFPSYDESRLFSTWMYRVALNVAISYARSNGERERQSIALDDTDAEPIHDGDAALENDDGVRALYHFIAQLDALNRALLLLYLEEKSHREIAEILGISATNVATKIGRLKQRLRNDLGN